MKFSPDNRFLLSVARDRRWTLFENTQHNNADEPNHYELIATTDKKNGIHARIIWSCDWSPDSKFFVTASRDGKCVVWQRGLEKTNSTLGQYCALDTLELKNDSITAVAFAHDFVRNESGHYVVAVGLESGVIHIYGFHNGKWTDRLATIEKS